MVTNSHRCSMAPVFDSQHAVVTSRKGSEERVWRSSDEFFLWQILENKRRSKNPLLGLQLICALCPASHRLFSPVFLQDRSCSK